MTILERQVLVLNKSWIPINITSVRRAICLLYSDLARAVDAKTFQTYRFGTWCEEGSSNAVLRTVSIDVPIPDVIVLTDYNQLRTKAKLPFSRGSLLKRDRFVCQYCGKQFPGSQLTVDHIVPKSRGGKTEWLNCATACNKCNSKKDDKTPQEAGMKLKTEPFVPTWSIKLFNEKTTTNETWKTFFGKM